jgi:hypothetical protein
VIVIDPGVAILAATVTFQLGAAAITATRLHERDLERRPFRTIVIVLGVFATLLSIGQYVVAQNNRSVLEAKLDDADNFAHAAAHRVGVFAFKPGAGRRIAEAARGLGAPDGTVLVSAEADHDTSMVCVAVADAFRLAGWTVDDTCVGSGFFQERQVARTLSPVIVSYRPDQSARAIAIAAALSREGVETRALELEPGDRVAGTYPLSVFLRYL